MVDETDFWESFPQDPRDPAVAGFRASDDDREVVLRALGEAYAEGRLDVMEYDERADRVAGAKTLGELPGLLSDLILPTRPGTSISRAKRSELQDKAERTVRKQRSQAWTGAITWAVMCWLIWIWYDMTFPWPVFITVAGLGMALRSSYDIKGKTAEELRRLERKEAKKQLE